MPSPLRHPYSPFREFIYIEVCKIHKTLKPAHETYRNQSLKCWFSLANLSGRILPSPRGGGYSRHFRLPIIHVGPVVQRVDNAIQRISHYPVDK